MSRKQGELAGMETPSGDKELDRLAMNKKQLGKKRKRIQDAETEAGLLLKAEMKKKGFTRYENKDAGLVVILDTTEKVVIEEMEEDASSKAPDAEGDDDEIEMAEAGEQKAKKKKPRGEAPAEA